MELVLSSIGRHRKAVLLCISIPLQELVIQEEPKIESLM